MILVELQIPPASTFFFFWKLRARFSNLDKCPYFYHSRGTKLPCWKFQREIKKGHNSAFISVKSRLLGYQIRNEEAINSARNRISSLKVFAGPSLSTVEYFSGYLLLILYRIRRFVSELLQYARINTRKSIWLVISVIAGNKPHDHHKTHLHTMKPSNASPSKVCSTGSRGVSCE